MTRLTVVYIYTIEPLCMFACNCNILKYINRIKKTMNSTFVDRSLMESNVASCSLMFRLGSLLLTNSNRGTSDLLFDVRSKHVYRPYFACHGKHLRPSCSGVSTTEPSTLAQEGASIMDVVWFFKDLFVESLHNVDIGGGTSIDNHATLTHEHLE